MALRQFMVRPVTTSAPSLIDGAGTGIGRELTERETVRASRVLCNRGNAGLSYGSPVC
jgi:short-subunit dehydrogenase involved in D-alanine esterification of teichoic acids